jgi:hypothetical protein
MHISRFRLAARGGLGLSLSAEQCRERAVKLGRNFDGALDERTRLSGTAMRVFDNVDLSP